MLRVSMMALALLALGACSSYKKGDVVRETDDEIRIKIGYNAVNEGVDVHRQAAEHCADSDRKAVWYAHDKDGNLLFKCE